MNNTPLGDLISKSAEQALSKQNQDGSFPAGHNGPYHDPETPVRNTSHWVFTLLRCYSWYGHKKFYNAAIKGLQYLKSDAVRPMKATFWCRKKPTKNFSNGLIGQAWAMETLLEAVNLLGDEQAYNLAELIFDLHPYDERRAGWKTVNVEGSFGGFNLTFNHQLWFAAVGSILAKHGNTNAKICIARFLDVLPNHLSIYQDGLIRHYSPFFLSQGLLEKGKATAKALLSFQSAKPRYYKSIGYHAFNTYALAMLKQYAPEHPVWSNKRVQKTIQYLHTQRYRQLIKTVPYGIEYNPPGIEVAYTLAIFEPDHQKEAKNWLNWQFLQTLDPHNMQMTRKSADPKTSAARIYEATRLSPSIMLNFSN